MTFGLSTQCILQNNFSGMVEWVMATCPPQLPFLVACGGWERLALGYESRRAGSAPHQQQHSGASPRAWKQENCLLLVARCSGWADRSNAGEFTLEGSMREGGRLRTQLSRRPRTRILNWPIQHLQTVGACEEAGAAVQSCRIDTGQQQDTQEEFQ